MTLTSSNKRPTFAGRFTKASLVLLLFAGACEFTPSETPSPNSDLQLGQLDLSSFAVLGGSTAAGFMDGALHSEGQSNTFGAILIDQVTSNSELTLDFNQPDVNSINGFNPEYSMGNEVIGRMTLQFPFPTRDRLFKSFLPGEPLGGFTDGGPVNNFSVPNIRLWQVFSPGLPGNPYYSRLIGDSGNNLLDNLIASDPSFVILNLGMEDILPYATNGATGSVDTDVITERDLTPVDLFESSYQMIIGRLMDETTAEVVVMNIPDVLQFPFFNAIPSLVDVYEYEVVDRIANTYGGFNVKVNLYNETADVLRPRIIFLFQDVTRRLAVVEDSSLPDATCPDGEPIPKIRQLVREDPQESLLWSLPQLTDSIFGTREPIPEEYYLSRADKDFVRETVDRYNDVIEGLASTQNRIKLFDLHTSVDGLFNNGDSFNGVALTADMSRRGLFSADGINFNQRGQAWLANELIDFLNQTYGSEIPVADINDFRGNLFFEE